MMGYDNWGAMGGVGFLGVITWIVIVVDLVLVGIFLLKQINKK